MINFIDETGQMFMQTMQSIDKDNLIDRFSHIDVEEDPPLKWIKALFRKLF